MKKILLFLFLFCSIARAQEIPPPVAGSYVHDFAGVLTKEQRATLHSRLIELKKKYTIETAIVTVETTGEYVIDDYSLKLGREWGVGGKSNNGIVILTAINDRKWRIDVGYGLEGDLTDAGSSSLAREFLVPRFKEQNYFQGFMDLVNEIDKSIDPATIALQKQEATKREEAWERQKSAIFDGLMNFLAIVGVILLIVLLWRWRKSVLARLERELSEAKYQLKTQLAAFKELKRKVERTTDLNPDQEQKEKVNLIWSKYENFYIEGDQELNDKKKILALVEKSKTFQEIRQDIRTVESIEDDLIEYRDLKKIKFDYSNIERERHSIIRSFGPLASFDTSFERESQKAEESQKKNFQQIEKIEEQFKKYLSDKKLRNARSMHTQYLEILSEAQSTNDNLRRLVSNAEEKKNFIAGFDKSVDLSVKLFLGIAAMAYISKETREDTERKAAEILNNSKKLERSPENIGALREFMNNIDKGFKNLMKEKAEHDERERLKAEEERKKKEAEERKKREERRRREEEEEEERRRRNSYSSSYDYGSSYSSSSSSSSSDSYSGGSFGGGGSSGDW